MSFINASYFVAELNIPNSGHAAVAEKIGWFIAKYEPLFLQQLMGYPMYKAFVAGMNVTPPATPALRWLNILYGAEYTDWQGYTAKWKGLIVTDTPVFNLAGGLVYKRPQYLTAGVTAGFTAGVNTASFPDWIGWTPIITRTGVMKPDVEYSWDVETGELVLLIPGDKFGNNEYFFVQFELRTDGALPDTGITPNESCIANFIYYWLYRANVTQTSGFGEVITTAENSVNVNPRRKIASAWNEMHRWVKEFICFMDVNREIYPEWNDNFKIDALRYFGFMNPIF